MKRIISIKMIASYLCFVLIFTSLSPALVYANSTPDTDITTTSSFQETLFEWEDQLTSYNPRVGSADYHPSAVKLDDGRILYMYSRGTTNAAIYQSFAPDLHTFISQDDSVTGEQSVLTGLDYPRATVFHDPNGSLFFAVAYRRKTGVDTTARVEIYKPSSFHLCNFI